MGGPVGDSFYFEVASEIACQYDLKESPAPKMSWEKIKQGYAAIDRLYGQSNLKANRFAYMAYLLGTKPRPARHSTSLAITRSRGMEQWPIRIRKNLGRGFLTCGMGVLPRGIACP